mmetsp:Transcript_27926/g.44981  ORF Transcript_27926/g.44981 Transcript_27926/m.44981 type:complete len:245 (-) Transcript_27926:490-1224(-)
MCMTMRVAMAFMPMIGVTMCFLGAMGVTMAFLCMAMARAMSFSIRQRFGALATSTMFLQHFAKHLHLKGHMSNAGPTCCLDCATQSTGLMFFLADDNVGSGEDLRRSHGPNVKVMNRNNIRNLLNVPGQLVLINPGGSLAHQRLRGSDHGGFCSVQHNHAKQAGAHGIRIVPLAHLPPGGPDGAHIQRLKPYAECCNANAQRLYYVANYMSKGSLNSNIVVFAMRMPMVITTMRMSMAQHLHQN